MGISYYNRFLGLHGRAKVAVRKYSMLQMVAMECTNKLNIKAQMRPLCDTLFQSAAIRLENYLYFQWSVLVFCCDKILRPEAMLHIK